MDIVGYSDRLCAAPSETIRFMVSTQLPNYEANLVRLVHGDESPEGPGFKETEVPSTADGTYPGRHQELRRGSHVIISGEGALADEESFTLQAWIWSTTPGGRPQGLLSRWDQEAQLGYALVLDELGAAALWLGSPKGTSRISTSTPLFPREWYFLAAMVDGASGRVLVTQHPLRPQIAGRSAAAAEESIKATSTGSRAELVIAGWAASTGTPDQVIGGHFNGKIDSPRIFATALDSSQLEALRGDAPPDEVAPGKLVAAWDFSKDIPTQQVTDVSGNARHGVAVNLPMRAVTGHNWTGGTLAWPTAPGEYGAIYFHDDDLENAHWKADFELTLPSELESGVYAMRLRSGEAEDYLPFVARPPRGLASSEIAVLLPTNSYLAYANEHYSWTNPEMAATGLGDPMNRLQPQDRFMAENHLLSLYDSHSDGSGVSTSSWLRPILSLRPKFFMQLIRAPHQFNADLHLIDWLHAGGFRHDVIVDHDLHSEGTELLRHYRVVVTGSHPEYWTEPMLDAMEDYLASGGRLMYLGGNGFFWATAIRKDLPHVIEVRRGHAGNRPWESAPGEEYLSATGEPAGKWRYRGRPPQRLVGVGYTTQGSSYSRPYRRLPDSHDPRSAFIFEGLAPDEVIGDFGLVMGGAGGAETDRYDLALGTPPHALRLATADGFTDHYQAAQDDFLFSDSKQGGTVSPLVRADMTFFEMPNGGAVFTPGSISWCGSLSHHNYQNNVSRITRNVLSAFASREWQPEVPGL